MDDGTRVAGVTVREIMQADVLTVPSNMSVGELAQTLLERGISGAPVVDREGRVIGVVSASDVLRLVSSEARIPGAPDEDPGSRAGLEVERSTEGGVSAFFRESNGNLYRGSQRLAALLPPAPFGARTVGEIMMPARFSVRPETTLAGLARFLVRTRVHRALVMVDGELRGIVTTFDVMRAIAETETEGS